MGLEKQLTSMIESLMEQNKEKDQRISELTDQIQRLTEQIEYMNRKFFGTSREKTLPTSDKQLSLFEDSDFLKEAETTAIETVEEVITYRRKRPIGRKAELIKDLPEVEVHCDLSEEECLCSDCGNYMKWMGKRLVRTDVNFIPARLEKHMYYQHSYACNCHDPQVEAKKIVNAPVPAPAIQRSLASASVLAWLIHQKFELSLPTYRQESEWESYGLAVPRRTLSNWIIRSAEDWLSLIYDRLHHHLIRQPILHMDETPYQVNKRSDGKPASSNAYFWLARTTKAVETPIVFYHADLTRKQSVVKELLGNFSGFLQVDGYSAYKNLPNVTLIGCVAHLRRKFFDVCGKDGKGAARKGLDFCNQIFKLEDEFATLTAEERYLKRKEETLPIMEQMYQWMDSIYVMKGKLKEAITYAINQKKELMNIFKDGRLQVSNNICEQKVKPIALGRKNFLFSDSMAGAKANAICYTIVETAKENGLNAFKYLTYLFENLPNLENYRDPEVLEAFLPWQKPIQEMCSK